MGGQQDDTTRRLRVGIPGTANIAGVTDMRVYTVTLDPAAVANTAAAVSLTVVANCTGVAIGDFVIPSAPVDLTDLMVTAYVQAANVIEVEILNRSATASINMASGDWKFLVIKAS